MDGGTAEAFRSHFLARPSVTWSMDKVVVAVAVGVMLIAMVLRLTFGYGLVL